MRSGPLSDMNLRQIHFHREMNPSSRQWKSSNTAVSVTAVYMSAKLVSAFDRVTAQRSRATRNRSRGALPDCVWSRTTWPLCPDAIHAVVDSAHAYVDGGGAEVHSKLRSSSGEWRQPTLDDRPRTMCAGTLENAGLRLVFADQVVPWMKMCCAATARA